MKKLILLIVASFGIVFWIVLFYGIYKSSGSDFGNELLDFGFAFSFLGLLSNFILWASSGDKNSLRWFKKRLELDEKIAGMGPREKIAEEIKLLKEGKFHGEPDSRVMSALINRFESMPLEKAEKIGTEEELRKLRRVIKFREEIFPFLNNALLVSGFLLILIQRVYFK